MKEEIITIIEIIIITIDKMKDMIEDIARTIEGTTVLTGIGLVEKIHLIGIEEETKDVKDLSVGKVTKGIIIGIEAQIEIGTSIEATQGPTVERIETEEIIASIEVIDGLVEIIVTIEIVDGLVETDKTIDMKETIEIIHGIGNLVVHIDEMIGEIEIIIETLETERIETTRGTPEIGEITKTEETLEILVDLEREAALVALGWRIIRTIKIETEINAEILEMENK
jgi:hypothetical protein